MHTNGSDRSFCLPSILSLIICMYHFFISILNTIISDQLYFFVCLFGGLSGASMQLHTEQQVLKLTECNMQKSFNTYRGSFVIIGNAVLGGLRFTTDMGLWEQSGGGMRDWAVLNLSPSWTVRGHPKAEMISGPALQTICLSSLAFPWTTVREIYTVYAPPAAATCQPPILPSPQP